MGGRRRGLLILFARAPRLGTVKRRLAREAGDAAALRFHRAMLRALARGLGRDRRWRTVLAVTPDRARFPTPLPRVAQGRGDLGERMARALARHRRRPGALLAGGGGGGRDAGGAVAAHAPWCLLPAPEHPASATAIRAAAAGGAV